MSVEWTVVAARFSNYTADIAFFSNQNNGTYFNDERVAEAITKNCFFQYRPVCFHAQKGTTVPDVKYNFGMKLICKVTGTTRICNRKNRANTMGLEPNLRTISPMRNLSAMCPHLSLSLQ